MQFTNQNFKQEVEDVKELVVVDFFASWCGPCKLMAPIIDELEEEYREKGVKIGKIDIDENQEIAGKYEVSSIPTVALFKDGKIIDQATGLQSKEVLTEMINKNL